MKKHLIHSKIPKKPASFRKPKIYWWEKNHTVPNRLLCLLCSCQVLVLQILKLFKLYYKNVNRFGGPTDIHESRTFWKVDLWKSLKQYIIANGSFSSLWTLLHTRKTKNSFNCNRQTGCSGNLTKTKLKPSCVVYDPGITFQCGCWFINQWFVRWTIYKPASLRFSVFPSTMTSAPINFALWSRSAMISVAILTREEYGAMHVI